MIGNRVLQNKICSKYFVNVNNTVQVLMILLDCAKFTEISSDIH